MTVNPSGHMPPEFSSTNGGLNANQDTGINNVENMLTNYLNTLSDSSSPSENMNKGFLEGVDKALHTIQNEQVPLSSADQDTITDLHAGLASYCSAGSDTPQGTPNSLVSNIFSSLVKSGSERGPLSTFVALSGYVSGALAGAVPSTGTNPDDNYVAKFQNLESNLSNPTSVHNILEAFGSGAGPSQLSHDNSIIESLKSSFGQIQDAGKGFTNGPDGSAFASYYAFQHEISGIDLPTGFFDQYFNNG